jgi:hypothetical protein
LVKKSLSWLGIAQEQVFEQAGRTTAIGDSDRNGEASTSGIGAANKETTPSTALERLYPDLRDFIVSLKSSKDDRGQNRNPKVFCVHSVPLSFCFQLGIQDSFTEMGFLGLLDFLVLAFRA